MPDVRWGVKESGASDEKKPVAVGRLPREALKEPAPEEPKTKPAKAPSKAVAALASKKQESGPKVETKTAEEEGVGPAEAEKRGVGRLGEGMSGTWIGCMG